MSAALLAAERPHPPAPLPDRTAPAVAGPAAPANIVRVLHVIRWIISYGTELASTLRQRATRADFRFFAARYRDGAVAVILARIRRGLLIAGALEARLAARAAKGRNISPSPPRLPSPHPAPSDRSNQPRAPRRTNLIDLPPDRLPTVQEIAAELRRRPLGAVLVDICRDFGIRPGDLTGTQWHELLHVIVLYDGDIATLLFRESPAPPGDNRSAVTLGNEPPMPQRQPIPPGLYRPATPAICTGPP